MSEFYSDSSDNESEENNIKDQEINIDDDDEDNEVDDNSIQGPQNELKNINFVGEEVPQIYEDDDEDDNIEDDEYDDDDENEDDEDEDDENNIFGEQNEQGVSNKKPKKTQKIIESDGDDEDDDDDTEENYLQKFDAQINKNYIFDFHPECISHNYDEISSLTKVVRDSDNIIIDPLHKTIPFLTKYERARVLGQRAKQIETGARPLVKVPETIVDSYVIAELELQQKRIPFIIRRPFPNGGCEYWNLKDLEIILF
jgi:DNA-directed RNA polymerase subunit K/omega